jgi:hypothetical protein
MADDTPLVAAYRQVRRNAGLRAASTGTVDGIVAARLTGIVKLRQELRQSFGLRWTR